ncbi:hypothetical protein Ahia01_000545800 [Argonauta hians]
MKTIARGYFWWPGLDRDIEHSAKECSGCMFSQPDPSPSPLHPWSFPEKPWHRVHIDYAGPFHSRMFLIVIDAHSKWAETRYWAVRANKWKTNHKHEPETSRKVTRYLSEIIETARTSGLMPLSSGNMVPFSYSVKTSFGATWRRHVDQMTATETTLPSGETQLPDMLPTPCTMSKQPEHTSTPPNPIDKETPANVATHVPAQPTSDSDNQQVLRRSKRVIKPPAILDL